MRSILTGLLFLSAVCAAQIPEYYVYLVKGDVMVQKPGKKSEKIKQKYLIFKDDILLLPKNAEVTLVNKDANYVVLNSPGLVKAKDLEKKTHDSYTGVTKKYMNLVWHELLDPDYDLTKFKKQNLGGVWGGASRGEDCNNLIFPINGLKTSSDSMKFKWHKTTSSSSYTFYIYDDSGSEIVKMETSDTVKLVDIRKALKSKPGKYYWLIKGNDKGCEEEVPLYFELMSREDESTLIASLIPQTQDDDLISQLEKLDKLEKNGLIFKAYDYYATIIKANAGNLPLLKSYIIFLFKYGFDAEAESEWENLVHAPR